MHQDPRRLDEVWDSARELGLALGKEEQAQKAVDACLFRWQALAARAQGKSRPRVYVEEWHDPPTASGNWVPELVRAAGGEPWDLLEPGRLSEKIGWEEMLEFCPQMVVHSICGLSTAYDPAKFKSLEGYERLDASVQGFLFSVDDSLLNVPSPRLIDGLELVQDLIGECFWGWHTVGSDSVRRLAAIPKS
jgi:iron complex transport system substrate-binding protein